VQAPSGTERRPIVFGRTNDKVIEVKDGVREGESVLLNPRAIVADARNDGMPAESGAPDAQEGKKSEEEDGAASPSGSPGASSGAPASANRGAVEGKAEASQKKSKSGGGDFLRSLDTDGDGKISKAEAPVPMQAGFDRLDANHDGFLDAAEMAALRRAAGGQGGGRQRGGEGRRSPGGEGRRPE
jgi:hypothetical protein